MSSVINPDTGQVEWNLIRQWGCEPFRALGCEFVRAAIKGELWNELAIGIGSRFCAREKTMDFKGLARWRGLVRVKPEIFWMRETTTEGRFVVFLAGVQL